MFLKSVFLTAAALPLLFITTSCAERHYFVPASRANVVPNAPYTGRATVAGIAMDVKVNSWRGDPADLESIVTPVKLTVTNEGNHPLSLRYKDFTLSNPTGVQSSALPPFKIRAYETEAQPEPIVPAFAYRNFLLYPYYGFYGPSLAFWPDDWGWDSAWYGTYFGYWQKSLPTADMLQKAIPEGVLNPNGSLSGYLYFQRVPGTAPALEFDAALIDARTHDRIGKIGIPFETESK